MCKILSWRCAAVVWFGVFCLLSPASGQDTLRQLEGNLSADATNQNDDAGTIGELPAPNPNPVEVPRAPVTDRPALGVNVIDVTPKLQADFGLAVRQAVSQA